MRSNSVKNIHALVRQVYRWHVASTQDEHPIIKMLHSNYAVGYIGALRSIATENQVFAATGLSLGELEAEVIAEQDAALIAFVSKCPGMIPKSPVYKDYVNKFLSKQRANVS